MTAAARATAPVEFPESGVAFFGLDFRTFDEDRDEREWRSSLTAMRADVTTLDASEVDPALDTSVNVDGVACCVSSWFAQNVTRARLVLAHPA